MTGELVLVTGAGGFLALHVVNTCLKHGYKVRGTVRDLKDERKTGPLRKLEPWGNLDLVEADLLDKSSLDRAVRGVDYVLHVASPFPSQQPKDESEVVRPAVDGTNNVLQAVCRHQVKRVVVTSSTAAFVGYEREKNFTETDWPEIDKVTRPYVKSKVLAERAAWDFVEAKRASNEPCFELVVINPSFILGLL
jgi:nucleoside-diphosphate-sugar epimerase